ncbi:MAG TPA: SpoIIE family protein phosphatase, partial [Candidatus Cloacimonas sp.]|nr:SpoIIE family protein phosphatase [Candidatus Cloacimonas sp.]
KNIISLTNNSEYKGKIDISFIADKLSIKIPDFIQKREGMIWNLLPQSVLDTEKEILYINAYRLNYGSFINIWGYDRYTPDVLNTLIFKQISYKEQEFLYPCISLNLRSGEVKLHPHWLQVFRDAENRLYALDKDIPGPKGRVFIRQIINGEAISSKDDPELSYSELVKNYLEVTQLNNNLLLQIGNTLYYLEEGKWQKLLVANLEQYGELQNGVKINGNIYLGCESRVVKVLPDGSTFVFGESEGIPEGALSLYKVGQKIIIKNETGLYEFLEAGKNVKTVLAGFWAGEQLVSASIPQKFSYKTHSVRFPVYILNTLYPEKCFLEYQLQGYNDLPVRIPFAEEIRFDNLKPGAYSFSYTVITETGQRVKSPVVAFTIKHPLYATGWAYAVYVIAFLSALWGIYKLRTRQLKLRNLDLEKTVAERTQELKERQQRLQESIEYASLIQKSILPQKTDLQQHFPNQFVLWRPRDIVGGDFYWLYAPDSFCTYFALIDCTGHGVPGALLSMTVNSLLDNLVKDRQLDNPAEILANLHLEISTTLHQRSEQAQQDGVEIALLKIEAANKLLTFCGAGLNLVHYLPDKDEFHFQRGDKHSLGGAKWFETLQFENHKIIYNAGDRIYLYTDGIIDQPALNSEPPKRLGTQPWLDYLQSIADKPFAEQLDLLHLFVNELITFHEQRDDITVIGIEPP